MSNQSNNDIHSCYVNYLEQLWNYFYVTAMKTAVLSAYSRHLEEDRNIVDSFPLTPILQESLQVDCVLTITKLTEEGRSQKNIPSFLNFTESNWTKIHWNGRKGDLTPQIIIKQRGYLEDISSILNGFQGQRDKYFAHYDNEYFFDPKKLFEEYPNINRDLREVLKVVEKIFNEHYLYLSSSIKIAGGGAYLWDRYVGHHLELMQKAQRKWNQEKQENNFLQD